MHVRRLIIENVKGLANVDLALPAAGWTVIAGPNASGKTTLLQAIALALTGIEAEPRLLSSRADWLRRGERKARVGVVVDTVAADTRLDEAREAEEADSTPRWLDLAAKEERLAPGAPVWAALEWSYGRDPDRPQLRPWKKMGIKAPAQADEGPWREKPRGWFVAGYGPHRRLSLSTKDRLESDGRSRVERVRSLFEASAVFQGTQQWVVDLYRAIHQDYHTGSQAFRIPLVKMLNDGLLPGGVRFLQDLSPRGLQVEQGGDTFHLDELSDGFRNTVALVLDIIRQLLLAYPEGLLLKRAHEDTTGLAIHNPGVVLIDEVDLHLHPALQQSIGGWLKAHFPQIQFIVSTHSPFIAQAADPGGLIRLPAPGRGGAVEVLSDEQYQQVVRGSSDDAVVSELFGLPYAHSPRTEADLVRLGELERKVFRGKATETERTELVQLRKTLPPSAELTTAMRRLGTG